MITKDALNNILKTLDDLYGVQACFINHGSPWQLLVGTMLAAQCTDARVNMVTPELFAHFPNAATMAQAQIADVEADIHSVGLYRAKAANIINMSRKLVTDYEGEVPSDMDALTALPGVGRKTANCIRGEAFGIPSIAVDTHVRRITKKLGLTESDDPVHIEHELEDILPQEHWIRFNPQIITLGRTICTARHPDCPACPLRTWCRTGRV